MVAVFFWLSDAVHHSSISCLADSNAVKRIQKQNLQEHLRFHSEQWISERTKDLLRHCLKRHFCLFLFGPPNFLISYNTQKKIVKQWKIKKGRNRIRYFWNWDIKVIGAAIKLKHMFHLNEWSPRWSVVTSCESDLKADNGRTTRKFKLRWSATVRLSFLRWVGEGGYWTWDLAITRQTLYRLSYLAPLKIWNASRICVSPLRRGHVNHLCIVPILLKWL